MSYIKHIEQFVPKNEQEAQDKKVILECVKLFPGNLLTRDNEIAHITSSGFIVNRALDKSLMAHHNIRNSWAWTGGHVDGNENFLEVAIKEAFEETGVSVKPLSEEIASIDILNVTGHIKRRKYVNSHLHLSVAYILIADENEASVINPDENSAVEWFPAVKINGDLFSIRDIYLYNKLFEQAKLWVHG